MSELYVVAEYLEGIRISAKACKSIDQAREMVESATRLGIDCEVWCRVDSVTGELVPVTGHDSALGTVMVCLADVPRYCGTVADLVRHPVGEVA